MIYIKTGKRVTLRDIARRAGVSATTVSNVLNGRFEQVSRDMAERIKNIAAEMGYQMRERKVKSTSTTLGMVVPEFTSELYGRAIKGAVAAASRLGFQLLLASSESGESAEVTAVASFLEHPVQGIIFLSSSRYTRSEALRLALSRNVPCVVINRNILPEQAYHILFKNEEAVYQATKHLIQMGYRKIGTIHLPITGNSRRDIYVQRYQGYIRALEEHGLPVKSEWMREGLLGDEPGALSVASRLAEDMFKSADRPTALVCGTDTIAIGALWAAKMCGLAVPDDVALVGFDATIAGTFISPPLTTIMHPTLEAGQRAVEVIAESLWKGVMPTGIEWLPCKLIIRGSTSRYEQWSNSLAAK